MQNEDAAAGPGRASDRSVQQKAKPLRLLVVDDDPALLDLLKTTLWILGDFKVSVSSGGADAIRMIDQQDPPFEMCLIDVTMPGINGITLCETIRQNPTYRHVPVIMLTTAADKVHLDAAYRAGATDYANKPVDIVELRGRLNTARRLAEDRRQLTQAQATTRRLRRELETNHQFSFSDPIAIQGVDRMLGYSEFAHHLAALPLRQRFGSSLTPVQLHSGKTLHRQMSSSLFKDSLHDVAQAIAKMTKTAGCVLSYRGNGLFLVLNRAAPPGLLPEHTARLDQMIGAMRARQDAEQDVHIQIKPSIRTRALTRFGLRSLLLRADDHLTLTDASPASAPPSPTPRPAKPTDPRPDPTSGPDPLSPLGRLDVPSAETLKAQEGYQLMLKSLLKDDTGL